VQARRPGRHSTSPRESLARITTVFVRKRVLEAPAVAIFGKIPLPVDCYARTDSVTVFDFGGERLRLQSVVQPLFDPHVTD